MEHSTCLKCGASKPRDQFKKNREGITRRCRECIRAAERDPAFKAKRSARLRKRYATDPVFREICRSLQRATYAKVPRDYSSRKIDPVLRQQRRARVAVRKAVLRGKLPSPKTLRCVCSKPAVEYHHPNGYSREHYRDVVPICKACHVATHARYKAT